LFNRPAGGVSAADLPATLGAQPPTAVSGVGGNTAPVPGASPFSLLPLIPLAVLGIGAAIKDWLMRLPQAPAKKSGGPGQPMRYLTGEHAS